VPIRLITLLDERLDGHERAVLIVAMVLALVAGGAAVQVRQDMSFRPLFTTDRRLAAATAAFEAQFGQSSGAHVAIMLEREAGIDAGYVEALGRLTTSLAGVEGVIEVVSPVRIPALEWTGSAAVPRLLADPAEMQGKRAADHAAALRSGVAAGLVADSSRATLVLVRVTPPIEALERRRVIADELRAITSAWLPEGVTAHFTGVPVVEAAYAAAVPAGMVLSLLLTTAAVALLLYAVFGHVIVVVIALGGVALAAPLMIALLALSGRSLTMLSSMAPTIVLIVGAADAVHMLRRWQIEAACAPGAVGRMVSSMALPCALTTLTTALGFASLAVARVAAIRDFGVLAAVGVLLVFAANFVLVPALLRCCGRRIPPPQPMNAQLLRALGSSLMRRPAPVLLAATLITALGALGATRLRLDQRFNEELSAGHPVRIAQSRMESHFGGFLGPAIEIRRTDGGSVLAADALAALDDVTRDITAHPDVAGVASVLDLIPERPFVSPRAALDALRDDNSAGPAIRERLHTSESVALHVTVGDLGTAAALTLTDSIVNAASVRLGAGYDVRAVGQWWLAQHGMATLLRDMLLSFATAALLVLPVLAITFRSWRLLLVALPANLLPMLCALAFMGWTGMPLRIGTALVLAVALAIAVDDTIHILARATELRNGGRSAQSAMLRAIRDSGSALVTTTAVLLAGFLSMAANPLAAIRDMGVVAAVAIAAALVADLVLLPVLYTRAAPRLRHRGAVATSSAVSVGTAAPRRFSIRHAAVAAAGSREPA
jgi:uncharacterized protein